VRPVKTFGTYLQNRQGYRQRAVKTLVVNSFLLFVFAKSRQGYRQRAVKTFVVNSFLLFVFAKSRQDYRKLLREPSRSSAELCRA